MPEGRITRGTTGANRLRRVDRYLQVSPALRTAVDPLVVDLGFGASPWTTLELADRLARVRPDVDVVGLEIDPDRVQDAISRARPGVRFSRGGFEIPTARPAAVIRAMNVLRQYREDEVASAWARMTSRLSPEGLLVEGTCDELGRVATWVDLDRAGPRRLTISLRLAGLERPGIAAERLPKALIHRNVPGERVHLFLLALDAAWVRAGPLGVYGPVQRFIAACATMRAEGWPTSDDPRRHRLGELSVDWSAVAPS